jgi:hypothetical protein
MFTTGVRKGLQKQLGEMIKDEESETKKKSLDRDEFLKNSFFIFKVQVVLPYYRMRH